MEGRQISLVLALAIAVALLFAMPVVGSGVDGSQAAQVENNTTSEENSSFGEQLSAFMQTSAVDANTTVETGMWNAGVNASAAPERDVTNRTAQLERERQQLARKATQLREKRDRLPRVAYTAQASSLRERIRSLQERINGTERTAQRVGVNASALDRLRTQTANMSGPEVSAVARNITDAPRGPPAGVPGGPPGETGPPNDTTGPPTDDNATDRLPSRDGTPRGVTDPGNETGPPAGHQEPPNRADGQNQTGVGPDDRPNRTPAGNQTAGPDNRPDGETDPRDNGPGSDSDEKQGSEAKSNSSTDVTDTTFGAVSW
ncbi:hypothetical protein [Salinibaculum salinum]|uniref:hypothetical protein n=1 Tax=Salinibaculum salinum TaxID=3131996 RepID=UPI0030EE478F